MARLWFFGPAVWLPPIAMTTAVPGKPNRHPLSDVGPIRLSESHAESFGAWWWSGKGETIARQRAFLSHSEANRHSELGQPIQFHGPSRCE
jgi:hypothetical protein